MDVIDDYEFCDLSVILLSRFMNRRTFRPKNTVIDF
jgi:hypothetical protein